MKDPNPAPFYACLYPGLCDVAREHGYALALHGSMVSDMDIIAIPWIEGAAPTSKLLAALKERVQAMDYRELLQFTSRTAHVDKVIEAQHNLTPDLAEIKPHGRKAWNLYLQHGCKIDVSVIPVIPDPAPTKPFRHPLCDVPLHIHCYAATSRSTGHRTFCFIAAHTTLQAAFQMGEAYNAEVVRKAEYFLRGRWPEPGDVNRWTWFEHSMPVKWMNKQHKDMPYVEGKPQAILDYLASVFCPGYQKPAPGA